MTTLLVSSGGGHLQQLIALQERMQLPGDVAWAAPKSGLTDRLRGQSYYEIPYIRARDWVGASRLTGIARRIIAETGAKRIVSTGAAPAPPFFLAGAAKGLDLHYVETATRSNGPSLSGRLVSLLPSAHLYTQYRHLAEGRWKFRGSIFDSFEAAARPRPERISKVVVSLGTERFGFRRALEAVHRVVPPAAEVLWQTGATDAAGLPIDARETVPAGELRAAISESDLFICHAGTGSALTGFELGKQPVLLAREARFGEHIDDHQLLTANELSRRGLAVTAPVGELSHAHLLRAAGGQVVSDGEFRPFRLAHTPAPARSIDLRSRRLTAA
ncbi:MAG: glycosyltransferase [Candidatus Nanopelagicales bacterium]